MSDLTFWYKPGRRLPKQDYRHGIESDIRYGLSSRGYQLYVITPPSAPIHITRWSAWRMLIWAQQAPRETFRAARGAVIEYWKNRVISGAEDLVRCSDVILDGATVRNIEHAFVLGGHGAIERADNSQIGWPDVRLELRGETLLRGCRIAGVWTHRGGTVTSVRCTGEGYLLEAPDVTLDSSDDLLYGVRITVSDATFLGGRIHSGHIGAKSVELCEMWIEDTTIEAETIYAYRCVASHTWIGKHYYERPTLIAPEVQQPLHAEA